MYSNDKRIFLIYESSDILDKLEKEFNAESFHDVNDAIGEIKKIKFEKKQKSFTDLTIIIVPNLYMKFKEKFYYENLGKITVIPKIVIFSEKGEEHFHNIYKYENDDPFFQFCKIKATYDELKSIINKKDNNSQSKKFELDKVDQLTFDEVDTKEKLALHLFYKVLIDNTDIKYIDNFTKDLYNKYQENEPLLKNLFDPIMETKNIPIELLSKYYIRAFTLETNFYSDMNEDLRKIDNKKISFYLIYIKYLYESIEYNIFPLVKQTKLFRGSLLTNSEIDKLKNFLEKNKDNNNDLPGAVVFSRTFLSFSKEKSVAEFFLKINNNTDPNLTKVLFILEKKEDINYDLATHADIEEISFYKDDEKEVLFFPFSTFEVKKIDPPSNNNGNIYEITLEYLGPKYVDLIEKYVKEIEEQRKKEKEEKEKKEKEEKEAKEKKEKEQNEINEENNVKEEKEKEKEENIDENGEKKEIKKFLIIEKIEDFEFKTQLIDSKLIEGKDITNVEDLYYKYLKYKKFKKRKKKFASTKIKSYIEGEIKIPKYFINKDVKILGCFDKQEKNYYSIIEEDLYKYKNKEDIKKNTQIEIDGKKIDFSFKHKFERGGKHKIKYTFKESLTKIDYLFSDCILIYSLDFSNFYSEDVINMRGLFSGCIFLNNINFKNFDSENVFDMSRMFYKCKSLQSPDLSYLNTKNVLDMRDMFYNCITIQSLNLTNFITNNVNNMSNMFHKCSSLVYLNLSNFNFERVEVMWHMFYGCSSLKEKYINNKSQKLWKALKDKNKF